MISTPIRLNPFEKANPMSMKDASIVATVAAAVTTVLTNIANLTLGMIRLDPIQVIFDCTKTFVVTWVSIFATETGLAAVVKHGEE